MVNETPLRAQHESLGASFGEWFGCQLPARYGDSGAEYRAARQAVVVLDTCYRACFYLTGPDRARYLNAVVTNNIQSLAAGQGTLGLLLNPQGHILAEVECLVEEERIVILSHASVGERTFGTLDKFIIMDDATLDDETVKTGSLGVEGPQAGAIVEKVCGQSLGSLAGLSHCQVTVGSVPCRLVRRSHFAGVGAEFIAGRKDLSALWKMLLAAVCADGGAPIGYAALNALRLEAGVPWFGYDFDEKVIPQEAALEKTHVSFSKGCYTGQEIVERVRSRGHVNRRRVGLRFSGKEAPTAGERLFAVEKEIGFVTSAAYSPGLGCSIGMGYLRRENTAPGSMVQCGANTATVSEPPRIETAR